MDYSQSSQNDHSGPFFTAGAGTSEENANTFQAENNLDLSNTQMDWSIKQAERDHRSIGNAAIGAPETTMNSDDTELEAPNPVKMGKVIRLEPRSETGSDKEPTASEVAKLATFDKRKIITRETLDESSVQEVQSVIDGLNKGADPADFYETARDMMEANLDNSYNRKLAA